MQAYKEFAVEHMFMINKDQTRAKIVKLKTKGFYINIIIGKVKIHLINIISPEV